MNDKIERGHVCEHGIRWPHACQPCDDAAWAKRSMTTTSAPAGSVIQSDRNAAVALLEAGGQDWQAKEVRLGEGDHFPLVQAFAAYRVQTEQSSRVGEDVREALEQALAWAYIKGAEDVHTHWTNNPGEAPRGDPEFGESASDYAKAALDPLSSAVRVPDQILALFGGASS